LLTKLSGENNRLPIFFTFYVLLFAVLLLIL